MVLRGDRLREARLKLGLSQRELSRRCRIGEQQIFRYEGDKGGDPRLSIVAHIAKELNVSVDYLCGLVDEPQGIYSGRHLTPWQARVLDAIERGDERMTVKFFLERKAELLYQELGGTTDESGLVVPPERNHK